MITKTYKSNTNVSINVVLPNKKNLHISFSPLSNGNSTFTTDNKDIQNAIEQHYNFGKLFRLIETQGEATKKTAKGVEMPTVKAEETGDNGNEPKVTPEAENEGEEKADATETTTIVENGEAETGLKKVTVSDLAAAKDYLADKFDISRTILRSKKAILEQAALHGVEFEGLS